MPPYQIHHDGQDYPWAVPISAVRDWRFHHATPFDNTSYGSAGFTVSHHVAADSNLLIVTVQIWRDTGAATTVTADWNGTPMDLQMSAVSGNMYSYVFSLVNPATGTHDVTLAITGQNISHKGSVVDLFVNGIPEVNNANNGFGTNGPAETSLSTSVDNTLIVDSVSQYLDDLTAAADQNVLADISTANATGASSFKVAGPAGTYSLSWTKSGTQDWAQAIVAFSIAAPGGTGQIKAWDGGAFVAKPVKVWDGSAWTTKPLKRWNGTAWVETSY